MINFMKELFGTREQEKFDTPEEILDEALALFKIADSNVRLLQGTIKVNRSMLVHYGIRETKKKEHIIKKLNLQLLEEKGCAVRYGNEYVTLKEEQFRLNKVNE